MCSFQYLRCNSSQHGMNLLMRKNIISGCSNWLARISEMALTPHTVWTADTPLGWEVAVKVEGRAWVVAKVACFAAGTTRFGTRRAATTRDLRWLIALTLQDTKRVVLRRNGHHVWSRLGCGGC
jgi:hypothetical protein